MVLLVQEISAGTDGTMDAFTRCKYYFVKSRIDAGEVIVQWYSGEKVVGDFFSKPLNGSKFLRFRRNIMNSHSSFKDEYPKQVKKSQKKKETAMVSVGMNRSMKSGYWSKKPGQKAVFISLPARQPNRKGLFRSKTTKGYKAKPMIKCSRYGKYIHARDRAKQHKKNGKNVVGKK